MVDGITIGYQEFCKEIEKWKYLLEVKYCLEEQIIMIYMEKNRYLLPIIVAILSSNNTFVLVDIDTPLTRINKMLNTINVKLIISDRKISTENRMSILNVYDVRSNLNRKQFNNKFGQGIAYIIFTSGTTGVPKGIKISKKALMNFMIASQKSLNLSQYKRILSVTSISFDIFLFETLYALYCGIEVVFVPRENILNPRKLLKTIKAYEIDILQSTPSRIEVLCAVSMDKKDLQSVQLLIIGGEAINSNQMLKVQQCFSALVYNAYGPSETTIWISYSQIFFDQDIDIGIPIEGNTFFLTDGRKILDKGNAKGELAIAGNNLFDGYIDENETKEKLRFIENIGAKVYFTGDICERKNGRFFWKGRIDNQVKIRGYRIELEEIERKLEEFEYIEQAVVLFLKSKYNIKTLVAVLKSSNFLEIEVLREWLLNELPEYMLPAQFFIVDEFPQLVNGKINKNKIKQDILRREGMKEYE